MTDNTEIRTEDLRLGNWVIDGYGNYGQVKNIAADAVSVNSVNYWRGGTHDLLIKPIPLSEEILLKSGFEKVATYNIMGSLFIDLGRRRQLSVACVGTPNELVTLYEIDSEDKQKINDLVILRNYDYDGKTYLHDLQNIIHSIAKTELQINF